MSHLSPSGEGVCSQARIALELLLEQECRAHVPHALPGQERGTGTAARRGAQGRISQWHCLFTSIHPRWEQEYRESRDGFGSASVHKLSVRLFSGTGTAWHRNDACVRSVKSSFPPKICSFTQTTRWEWFLNCTNLRRWRGRGCNIIWMPGKY